jgi:hypothetical protein
MRSFHYGASIDKMVGLRNDLFFHVLFRIAPKSTK